MGNEKTCPAKRQPRQKRDKLPPDPLGKERRIALGPEVWKRVFASPLYHQMTILFRQIFKRTIGAGDPDAMGLTPADIDRIQKLRGEKETLLHFPFCEIINKIEEGKRRCMMLAKQVRARISHTGEPGISTCHAGGLVDVELPIIFRGKYYGIYTVVGGLLLHEPNEKEWSEITERVKDLGVDLARLKKAYFEITPISKELLDVMIQLLNTVVAEIIKAAVETEEDKKRIAELESALYEKYKFEQIIGKSQPIRNLFKLLGKVIESDSPVLIEGDTGTGKELVASTIHYNSPRKDRPFNPVNCGGFAETLLESQLFGHIKGSFTGAISDRKGVFEVTNHGTIFLDEVAEMSPALQVKLLRVLQEGTFSPVGSTQTRKADVRIISATNKNLKELVTQGKFREDLYYRINVIKVALPPLRERKEDIPMLIDHFIKTAESVRKKKIVGVRSDVLKCLLDYSWPGNIRELQNVIERAIALASSRYITIEDLPEEMIKREKEIPPAIDIHKPYEKAKKDLLDPFQREYLSKMLAETGGNVTNAARLSGLSRRAFQDLLKKHHIKPGNFRV